MTASNVKQVFASDGVLVKNIPGFSVRSAQLELATAIEHCIIEKNVLIAEAGTGTGKTFAYLIPCLLSGEKAIVSTATKILQDQLYQKDLPALMRVLGLSIRVQNLKGRSNYICRYRVALHAEEGRFSHAEAAYQFTIVYEKLSRLQEGERSELPEIADDAVVWPYVTSTVDNCLGTECEFYQSCFLVKARRRAMDADLVIINHHLFFADSELKNSEMGELLPQRTIIVFDEAHSLPDVATHFFSEQISTRQIKDWFKEACYEWPSIQNTDDITSPVPADILTIPAIGAGVLSDYNEKISDALMALGSLFPAEEKILYHRIAKDQKWRSALEDLLEILVLCSQCFLLIDLTEKPALQLSQEKVIRFIAFIKTFLSVSISVSEAASADVPTKEVLWLEKFNQHITLHRTPLDVSGLLATCMFKSDVACVFTSATLAIKNQLEHYSRVIGASDAKKLLLPSPFDFQNQVLLYLPRGMPDPKNTSYNACLIAKILPLIKALNGRCFILFTSHRALREAAYFLSEEITHPILVQGDESKTILLERFRALGNAVLLGTSSFWEGVDVKGAILSCVIIDKLPFDSPNDPVIAGRMAYLKTQNRSAFEEMSLPDTIIALKQGVGRLIRDTSDKGILVIADPRLTSRAYGQNIFLSLPKMPKTRDETNVLRFIREELTG